jgi:hypothetical protein
MVVSSYPLVLCRAGMISYSLGRCDDRPSILSAAMLHGHSPVLAAYEILDHVWFICHVKRLVPNFFR